MVAAWPALFSRRDRNREKKSAGRSEVYHFELWSQLCSAAGRGREGFCPQLYSDDFRLPFSVVSVGLSPAPTIPNFANFVVF